MRLRKGGQGPRAPRPVQPRGPAAGSRGSGGRRCKSEGASVVLWHSRSFRSFSYLRGLLLPRATLRGALRWARGAFVIYSGSRPWGRGPSQFAKECGLASARPWMGNFPMDTHASLLDFRPVLGHSHWPALRRPGGELRPSVARRDAPLGRPLRVRDGQGAPGNPWARFPRPPNRGQGRAPLRISAAAERAGPSTWGGAAQGCGPGRAPSRILASAERAEALFVGAPPTDAGQAGRPCTSLQPQ